ncbi:MAG: hypothetical protein IJ489_02965 [Clostridia bacterium]|nr:hypothetical protein [Clostridia bacterium]
MKKNRKKDTSEKFRPFKSSTLLWLLTIPLLFLNKIIPHRPLVILCFVSITLMIAVNIIFRLVRKKWNVPVLYILMIILGAAFMNLLATENYTFADDETPLIVVSAALGIIIGTIVTIMLFRHKYKVLAIIGLSLCFAILFTSIFMLSAFHLNYLFDTKPPIECEAIIKDKDIDRHRKGPDDYELIVTIDGKRITMEVSSEEYHHYEIGDTYTFYRYQGAFDIPFYFEE